MNASTLTDKTLAHISTDKPFYMPGEIVWIEVYFMDSITKVPKYTTTDMYSDCVIYNSNDHEVFRSSSIRL